jgi:hypothetical protein
MKILKVKNNLTQQNPQEFISIKRKLHYIRRQYKNLKEATAISYRMQLFLYKSAKIRRNIYSVLGLPINATIL